MKKIFLNIKGKTDPKEIHEQIAMEFEFPNHYGKNLDALFDCLSTISTPTAVVAIIDPENEYHQKLKTVMDDAQEENIKFGVFWLN